jgi:hypothetical protein
VSVVKLQVSVDLTEFLVNRQAFANLGGAGSDRLIPGRRRATSRPARDPPRGLHGEEPIVKSIKRRQPKTVPMPVAHPSDTWSEPIPIENLEVHGALDLEAWLNKHSPPTELQQCHERWLRLWRGTLGLLRRQEPRAYRKVLEGLRRHGLAGLTQSFRREGAALQFAEELQPASGVESPVPPPGMLTLVHRFEKDERPIRLRSRVRARRAGPSELLIAYKAARWKLSTRTTPGTLRGDAAVSERAWAMVARHYQLTPTSVQTFLRDARRLLPMQYKQTIDHLPDHYAWDLTLGRWRGAPRRD